MPSVMVHSRKPRIPSDPAAAFGDDGGPISTAPPPRYDRPVGAAWNAATSPVTNEKLGNDQQMESGADEMSGVHDSRVSGGDYSREQGVGRAPGFRWPFNFHSAAFDFTSLDRWAVERTGAIGLPPNANPYEGVPERPESPIAAIDQDTTYYENDPDQWYYFSPPPMTIPEAQAPSFTERAVLGQELGFE